MSKNTKGAFGGGRNRHQKTDLTLKVIVPDDIRRAIAKVVRSVEWHLVDAQPGGLCFFRAITGWLVLKDLGIPAALALGGMVYRTGPNELRDVVAFCGPGNVGCVLDGHFLGHYWVKSAEDLIDFSVGDWRELTRDGRHDVYLPGQPKMDPIHWTVEAPDFFWAPESSFRSEGRTPELGRAWYTGYKGRNPPWEELLADVQLNLKQIKAHLPRAYDYYALKERLFAVREGHTAVRLSQIAELLGDPELLARAHYHDQLFVLRGKVEVTRKIALEVLAEFDREINARSIARRNFNHCPVEW